MKKDPEKQMSKLRVGIIFLVITAVMLLAGLTFLTVLFLGISDRPDNWWYVAKKIMEHPGYWLVSALASITAFGSWVADTNNKD